MFPYQHLSPVFLQGVDIELKWEEPHVAPRLACVEDRGLLLKIHCFLTIFRNMVKDIGDPCQKKLVTLSILFFVKIVHYSLISYSLYKYGFFLVMKGCLDVERVAG